MTKRPDASPLLRRAAASLVLFGWLCACHLPVYANEPERENGQAALAFRIDWRQDFSFGAKLTLPAVATNKRWYCIWIMLAEEKGTFEHPAMVQGGLIRWEQDRFMLQPFVAMEHSGGSIRTNLLPAFSQGSPQEHEFEISRRGSRIELRMDGKTILADPWYPLFGDAEHLYLKIAAEVVAEGDAISGTAREIVLTTPRSRLAPDMPFLAAEDRGLKFVCDRNVFTAVGKFDPKLPPSKWVKASCEGAK